MEVGAIDPLTLTDRMLYQGSYPGYFVTPMHRAVNEASGGKPGFATEMQKQLNQFQESLTALDSLENGFLNNRHVKEVQEMIDLVSVCFLSHPF